MKQAPPIIARTSLVCTAVFRPQTLAPEAKMKKVTPILIVEHVDGCAAFWTGALGFARTAEVPHGGETGFVILQKGGVELMYQSVASVRDDLPALADGPHHSVLYIETDDLDAVERAVDAAAVAVPRRTTFYGMAEIAVREPGGNLVVFAQPTRSQ